MINVRWMLEGLVLPVIGLTGVIGKCGVVVYLVTGPFLYYLIKFRKHLVDRHISGKCYFIFTIIIVIS